MKRKKNVCRALSGIRPEADCASGRGSVEASGWLLEARTSEAESHEAEEQGVGSLEDRWCYVCRALM